MNHIRTTKVLNRLVAIHYRSLSMYLADARPWTQRGDEAARDVLIQIAADQTAAVDRLGQMILEEGDSVDLGEYPMDFTGQHDLSMEYLLGSLILHQREDVAAIDECVQLLNHDPLAKAVAQETLGEAKGHLESLQELAEDHANINAIG